MPSKTMHCSGGIHADGESVTTPSTGRPAQRDGATRLPMWLRVLAGVLFVAIALHADILIRHLAEPDGKAALIISGPRTGLGDNYYYMTMLKHAPERFDPPDVRDGDDDQADHRFHNSVSNTYALPLYAANGIYQLARFASPDSRWAALLTSVAHTALLAFFLMLFLASLRTDRPGRSQFAGLFVPVFIGMVFLDAFGTSMLLGRPYWSGTLLTYYSNATRVVNPTLFWSGGLCAAAVVIAWLRRGAQLDGWGLFAALFCALCGVSSVAVGVVILGALCYCALDRWWSSRLWHWPFLLPICGALAGVAYAVYQHRIYALSQMGSALGHGSTVSLVLKWQFLALLLLALPIHRTFARRINGFVSGLVITASLIGLICASFRLGDRLWLRGGLIFVWGILLALALEQAGRRVSSETITRIGSNFAPGLAGVALMLFVIANQRPSLDTWNGYVDKAKWNQLDWIDHNIPAGRIIASANIEDAALIPLYTEAKPTYSLYGFTSNERDVELTRFFVTMRLFGKDRPFLRMPDTLTDADLYAYSQRVRSRLAEPLRGEAIDNAIFAELLLYLPFMGDQAKALTDPLQKQALIAFLTDSWNRAAHTKLAVDYAIVNKGNVPAGLVEWPVVYSGEESAIVRNPESRP